MRTERDHKAAIMFQKVKVNRHCDDSPKSRYSKLLAADCGHKQLKLIDKVHEIREDNGYFETFEGIKVVTLSSCECTNPSLPPHIDIAM